MVLKIFHLILDGANLAISFWVLILAYKFLKLLFKKEYDEFFEDYIGYIYPLPFLSIVLIFVSLSFGLDLHILNIRILSDEVNWAHFLEEIDELCYLMLLVYLNWLFPKLLKYPVIEMVISKLRLRCKGEWRCQLNR